MISILQIVSYLMILFAEEVTGISLLYINHKHTKGNKKNMFVKNYELLLINFPDARSEMKNLQMKRSTNFK